MYGDKLILEINLLIFYPIMLESSFGNECVPTIYIFLNKSINYIVFGLTIRKKFCIQHLRIMVNTSKTRSVFVQFFLLTSGGCKLTLIINHLLDSTG